MPRKLVVRNWWGLVFCPFPGSSGGDNTSSCLSSFYLHLSPWNSPLILSFLNICFLKPSWSYCLALKLHSSFSSFITCILHHFLLIVHSLNLIIHIPMVGGWTSRLNSLWTQRTYAHNFSLLIVVHLHTSSWPSHLYTDAASSCFSQIGWRSYVSPTLLWKYVGIAFPSLWESPTSFVRR